MRTNMEKIQRKLEGKWQKYHRLLAKGIPEVKSCALALETIGVHQTSIVSVNSSFELVSWRQEAKFRISRNLSHSREVHPLIPFRSNFNVKFSALMELLRKRKPVIPIIAKIRWECNWGQKPTKRLPSVMNRNNGIPWQLRNKQSNRGRNSLYFFGCSEESNGKTRWKFRCKIVSMVNDSWKYVHRDHRFPKGFELFVILRNLFISTKPSKPWDKGRKIIHPLLLCGNPFSLKKKKRWYLLKTPKIMEFWNSEPIGYYSTFLTAFTLNL
jgi:hypothetical protein